MSLKDLIAKNRSKLQRGANNRTEKLQSGKNIVRILPSWTGSEDDEFSQAWGQHFIKDTGGNLKAVYICTNTIFDEVCPICEAIANGMATNNDEDILKAMKDGRSSKRILVNAMYLQGGKNENPTTQPVVLELPPTVFEKILAAAQTFLEEDVNVFSLKEGHNFIIEKTGAGMNTEYSVTPSPKASVMSITTDKLVNLEDWARQEGEADKQKAIASVRAIAGIAEVSHTAPRLAAPTGTSATTSRLRETSVVDADFEEVAEQKPHLSGSDNIDDFLNDL